MDFSAAEVQERLDALVYARDGEVAGGFQAHHVERPDEAMMMREEDLVQVAACAAEADGEDVRDVVFRQELFHAGLNYFFADGAHPVDVVRRVFCLARSGAPVVLDGADGDVVRLVCGDVGEGLRGRCAGVFGSFLGRGERAVWRGTAEFFAFGRGVRLPLSFADGVDEFLFFVDKVLERVSGTDMGMMRRRVAPLSEVLRWDEARGEVEACLEGLLGFYFMDGWRPDLVLKRVFAVAKGLREDLICGMSLEAVAVLCGDGGRATVSARVKRVVNEEMDGCEGSRLGSRLSFQKSGSAVAKYRAAQMGNGNRRGSL